MWSDAPESTIQEDEKSCWRVESDNIPEWALLLVAVSDGEGARLFLTNIFCSASSYAFVNGCCSEDGGSGTAVLARLSRADFQSAGFP